MTKQKLEHLAILSTRTAPNWTIQGKLESVNRTAWHQGGITLVCKGRCTPGPWIDQDLGIVCYFSAAEAIEAPLHLSKLLFDTPVPKGIHSHSIIILFNFNSCCVSPYQLPGTVLGTAEKKINRTRACLNGAQYEWRDSFSIGGHLPSGHLLIILVRRGEKKNPNLPPNHLFGWPVKTFYNWEHWMNIPF